LKPSIILPKLDNSYGKNVQQIAVELVLGQEVLTNQMGITKLQFWDENPKVIDWLGFI